MGVQKSKPIENNANEIFNQKTNERSLIDSCNDENSEGSKEQTKVNQNGVGQQKEATHTPETLKNDSCQIKTTQEVPTNAPQNEEIKTSLKLAHIKKKVIKKMIRCCDGGDEYDNEGELLKETDNDSLNQIKVVSKKRISKQPEFTRFEMDYSKYEKGDESSDESQCSL